jgi:hypothetical protein
MPERTNPRHATFDYRSFAAYFVTICSHDRGCLSGTIRRGRMALNAYGRIVVAEWERSEAMRDEVVLDAFVVMPNHLHGIVCLVPPEVEDVSPRGYDLDVGPTPADAKDAPSENVGTTGGSSLHPHKEEVSEEKEPNGPSARSLSAMIGGFKAAVTTRIDEHRGTPGAPVWQSRYHDRILRNEREWRARREYVRRNPGRRAEDRHHPNR